MSNGVRVWYWVGLGVLLLFLCPRDSSASWEVTGCGGLPFGFCPDGAEYDSLAAAEAALLDAAEASFSAPWVPGPRTVGELEFASPYNFWPATVRATGGGTVSMFLRWYVSPDPCGPDLEEGEDGEGYPACVEPAPQCEAGADLGKRFLKVVPPGDWVSQAFVDLCMTAYGGGCRAKYEDGMCAGSYCTHVYEITGDSCTNEDGAVLEPYEDEPNCIVTGGDRFCADPNQRGNCGYVNDQFVCVESVPEGRCIFLGDGSMVCSDSATAPPAPDNGTPGLPAPPDIEITTHEGDTVNYYNSSTVAGSAGDVEGSQPGGDGTGGDGDGDGLGGGSGTASGDCAVPPTCEGAPVMCAILLQEWHSACQDVPGGGDLLGQVGLDGEAVGDLFTDGGDVSSLLDDVGWMSPSSRVCNIDFVVDLGFAGVHTIPFSEWCNVFEFAGMLVMLSAALSSMKIIGGAFV